MIRTKNKQILARQSRLQRYVTREWVSRLKGVPCFILGNGPSIANEPVHLLDKYFTIGINRAFKLLDPTILMWQDIGLWNTEHQKLHNLQCLKVCRDIADPRHIYYNFYLKGDPFQFVGQTHVLYGRGNSGALAAEFAVALGCSPIVFLGCDCCYSGKKGTPDFKTDFWGVNSFHTDNTLMHCVKALEFIRNDCPVPIINCSNTNVLGPRQRLQDVLTSLDSKHAIGRQNYVKKLVLNKN